MNIVQLLARKDLLELEPYSSARMESGVTPGGEFIFLDANENPFGTYNRYPEPQPQALIARMAQYYNTSAKNILVTRGSDEAIDLLIRTFCRAGTDGILQCTPTYGCYSVFAKIQDAFVTSVSLDDKSDIDVQAVSLSKTSNTKLVFLCSPNNPTGNILSRDRILKVCKLFAESALVVVDQAYIEFSAENSMADSVEQYPNLVVLRTLSKAHALAGIRCGALIANDQVIGILKKVIAPYPIPSPVVKLALKALSAATLVVTEDNIALIKKERERLREKLSGHKLVKKVFNSDSNFLLVQTTGADEMMKLCRNNGLVIRNRHKDVPNAVRITVGSEYENDLLLRTLGLLTTREFRQDRTATIVRETKETVITARVNLDKTDPVRIDTGIGFFNHMLEQLAKHGGFSINLFCRGDIEVDNHHSIEDCAIALGQAVRKALGDKAGIDRYGFLLPMDEAECKISLDLSGRSYLQLKGKLPDMVEHFMRSFSDELGATIHMTVTGENAHHKAESCFKCLGRALKIAIAKGGKGIPSTKGIL